MTLTFAPLKKSENLTIRLDAQTRFGVEIFARIRRRSVSEVVLEELRNRLDKELPRCDINGKKVGLLEAIWDEYEQDRMVKLALHAPQLLTPEERKIWRVISEDRAYLSSSGKPNFAAIRNNWRAIKDKVRDYEKSAQE